MPDPAGTAQLVRTVTVTIDGHKLDDATKNRLVESRVSQSIGAASRLELRFDDDDFQLIDGTKFDIGRNVSVTHSDEKGEESVVFNGEIAAIGIEQAGATLHQCVVEAFDLSHRLSQISHPRTFTKQKHSDIATKIAGEHGLSASVTDTLVTHEYILQAGTDWAMMDEIAARTGMEWLVEDKTLLLRKRPTDAGIEVELGTDLKKFRARFSGANQTDTVQVRGWDPRTKKVIASKVASAKSTAAMNGVSDPAGAAAFRTKTSNMNASKAITAAFHVETKQEADAAADALAARSATNQLSARGELLGNPNVKAGTHLRVVGMGTKMSGSYYVTTVEHIFGKGDLITRFTAGGQSMEKLVDLLGGQSPAVGGWGANGLVAGLVTDINDPDGLGRVRVQFPALSETDTSEWARIASPMAGKGRGLMMMPSVDDEVLVGFEQGDFRRPYVLGALWNAKDKPPFNLDGSKIVEYALKTLQGHVMSFGEEGGKEVIKLVHAKQPDTKLVLEKEKVQLWVGQNNMVEIKAGQATIVLDKDEIKITGKTITLKATTDLKMEAVNIEMKASVGVKIEGTTVDVKGQAAVTVDATGNLTLKGAMTMIN